MVASGWDDEDKQLMWHGVGCRVRWEGVWKPKPVFSEPGLVTAENHTSLCYLDSKTPQSSQRQPGNQQKVWKHQEPFEMTGFWKLWKRYLLLGLMFGSCWHPLILNQVESLPNSKTHIKLCAKAHGDLWRPPLDMWRSSMDFRMCRHVHCASSHCPLSPTRNQLESAKSKKKLWFLLNKPCKLKNAVGAKC